MEYIDTPYRVNNLFLTWHNCSRVKDGGEKGERMVMKIYPSFLWDTLSPSAFCLLRDGKSNGFCICNFRTRSQRFIFWEEKKISFKFSEINSLLSKGKSDEIPLSKGHEN